LWKSLKNAQKLLIDVGERNWRSVGTGVFFKSRGRNDPRMFAEVLNALADAIKELLHPVVNLANFTTAAIKEIGLCRAPQI